MRRLALAAALLLCACEEDFKPETVVEGLRVLAIRATPAEIAPGQTTALSALVVDPSRPGRSNTLLWLACEPDPLGGASLCSDTTALSDPSFFLGAPTDGGTPSLRQGLSFIGLNGQAAWRVREDLFAELPAEDARRRTGTVGQVLLLAVAEELPPLPSQEELARLFARVQQRQVPSLTALFRLRVTEEVPVNANPVLEGLRVDGEWLPPGATLRLAPDAPASVEVVASDDSFETYVQPLPDGTLETRAERLIASWYATSGRFEPERVVLRSDTPTLFRPPNGSRLQPLPEQRLGRLWAVVRDVRGGQSWLEVPSFLCDKVLPAPRVTSLQVEAGGGLVLEGENLASVLDVLVGGQAAKQGEYLPDTGRFRARLPSLPPGPHEVVVRGRHCQDEKLAERLTLP